MTFQVGQKVYATRSLLLQEGASIKFADAFDDWKDAVKDFYLPALRAWVITYNPDRPYIRV